MAQRKVKNPTASRKNTDDIEPEPATSQPEVPVKRGARRPRKAKEVIPAPVDTDPSQLPGVDTTDGHVPPSQPIRQKRARFEESDMDHVVPAVDDKVPFNASHSKMSTLTDLITQAEDKTNQSAAAPAPKKQKTNNSRKKSNQRTLPEREGRNVNPAAAPGVKPLARRSHAEVIAEREAKIKEAEEAYEKYKDAQRALAQLHVDEENSPESPNLRLSAAVGRKRSRTVLSIPRESDGESEVFDLDAVVGSSDELSDVARPVQKAPVKLKIKNGKPKEKGLRDNIEAMVGDLQKDGGREREKKRHKGNTVNDNTPFPALALAPQKYKDSGLLPADHNGSSPTKAVAADNEPIQPDNEGGLGGLGDEDAAAARPTTSNPNGNLKQKDNFERLLPPAGLRRDGSRLNETVEFLESSDSDSGPPKKAQAKSALKQASQGGGPAAVARNRKNHSKDSGNNEGSVAFSLSAETFLHDEQWKVAFLPSCFHSFYVSKEPLKHFKRSSEELHALVQKAFDLAFPHIRYEITPKHEILRTACSRIKTKRSLIAGDTLKAVQKHFGTEKYHGKPALIKSYVRWALRGDGPAYNLYPTPSDCTVAPTDEGYIPPDGIFQSIFMRTIAEKYLKHVDGSRIVPPIGDQSPPVGLYALIAASLERAFKSYASGVFNEPKPFTIEVMWPSVNAFAMRCQKLSTRRWNEILAGPMDDEVEEELNVSNISAFRDTFYIPESPVKPSGSL